MKSINKLIAVLLISAMTISMTACSKKQTPTIAPNSSNTISSNSSTILTSSNSSETTTSNASATLSNSSADTSSSTSTDNTGTTQKARSGGSTDSAKSINPTTAPNNSKQLTSTPNTTPSPSPNTTAPSTKPSTPTQPSEPTQPSTKPSEPSQPSKPKTAYDRPFDTNQIRNDMIAYGQSKGMQLDTSLWVKPDFSSNCSYFPPTNTSQDIGNATEFIQDCKDSIDYTIAAVQAAEPSGKVSDIRFNIVLLPNSKSSGDYYVFVLYG